MTLQASCGTSKVDTSSFDTTLESLRRRVDQRAGVRTSLPIDAMTRIARTAWTSHDVPDGVIDRSIDREISAHNDAAAFHMRLERASWADDSIPLEKRGKPHLVLDTPDGQRHIFSLGGDADGVRLSLHTPTGDSLGCMLTEDGGVWG